MLESMDDARVGAVCRAVRIRLRWRQADVAARARVSISLVSLIERGHLDRVSLRVLRRVAAVIDVRVGVLARWRGGELDRLLSSRHSQLQGAVAAWLTGIEGWAVVPEVSFSIWGERGSIDLLAWPAATRTLLVIEVKTELVDADELISTLDRKTRLAAWVLMAEGATNRRRVAQQAALLRAAYPLDGRQMRGWLRKPGPRKPERRVAALSFFSNSTQGRASAPTRAVRRVRRPSSSTSGRR